VRATARILVVAASVAALPALAAGPDEKPAKVVVRFKADKVVLGPDLGSATLTGHVKVNVGDVTITCKKLLIAYGGGKQVASFEARGKVRLVMEDLEATAAELDYDAEARTAVMRGGCTVKGRNVALTGETITLELDTRKISIDKASGTIDIAGQKF
jgi:lipopolysaccharide transport protein LptA